MVVKTRAASSRPNEAWPVFMARPWRKQCLQTSLEREEDEEMKNLLQHMGPPEALFRGCYFLRHHSINSNPVRFGYERGTHSSSNSKLGENRFRTASRVVPKGGPSTSEIK